MNRVANAGENTDLSYIGVMGNKRSHLRFKNSYFLVRKYPLAICLILLTTSGFALGSIAICFP